MLFPRIIIVSSVTLVAHAQSITTDAAVPSLTPSAVLPACTSAAVPPATPAALQEYLASVTVQPEYMSATQALASAMPASVLSQMETDTAPLGWWPMAGEAPSWVSAVPTIYVSYISSIRVAEWSILTGSAESPAPTNGPPMNVVGAALAVGAAGLAML